MLKNSKIFQSFLGKIYLGCGILIVIFLLNITVTTYIFLKNNVTIKNLSTVIDPSLLAISELQILGFRTETIVNKFLNKPLNETERFEINYLLKTDFPDLKTKLQTLAINWNEKSNTIQLDTILARFEKNKKLILNATSTYTTIEDYTTSENLMDTKEIYETEFFSNLAFINHNLQKINELFIKQKKILEIEIKKTTNIFLICIFINTFLLVLITALFAYFFGKHIKSKFNELSEAITNISLGKLSAIKLTNSKDEIGKMALNLMNYIDSLKKTTIFANEIGDSKLDTDFKPLSEHDELGKSLVLMRDNLKKVKYEQEQRNWTSVGLSRFSEILSDTTRSTDEICEVLLSNLVKYTNSIQGNVFLLKTDEETKENYFSLVAAYAFDRKKHIQKRIEIDEGLVGQCFLDNDKIFITDIPIDYINIKSGLGDAPPKCILLVPIRQNNIINGVLELTTFVPYDPYIIEFIERIGENMGTIVYTAMINENTRRLLTESQQGREELLAQEEEMRQNMEEMLATQEEISRKSYDVDKLIANEKRIYLEKEANYIQQIDELTKSNIELIRQNTKSAK